MSRDMRDPMRANVGFAANMVNTSALAWAGHYLVSHFIYGQQSHCMPCDYQVMMVSDSDMAVVNQLITGGHLISLDIMLAP